MAAPFHPDVAAWLARDPAERALRLRQAEAAIAAHRHAFTYAARRALLDPREAAPGPWAGKALFHAAERDAALARRDWLESLPDTLTRVSA